MKQVFIDTNILVDLLADRLPFSKYAIRLFDLAEKKQVKLWTSTHAFATTHYLLKKHIGEKELREILYALLDYVELIAIDSAVIKKSLLSPHKDFEDAIQILAATSVAAIDLIVTRNLKDFATAGITVLPPDEVFGYL